MTDVERILIARIRQLNARLARDRVAEAAGTRTLDLAVEHWQWQRKRVPA